MQINKEKQKFSIKKRLASFRYAWNGLIILIKEEHNARIHLIAAIGVVILGCIFKISALEWISICFAIGLVFSIEAINSAIENISDYISPEYNLFIKKTKDLSAAAVLIGAIIAIIIALIIFIPKIIEL